jgi:MFS family permease
MSRLSCGERLLLSSRLSEVYIIVRDNQLFVSLKIKDFQLLWISSAFAAFGLQMRAIAQGWLIYELTQSPMALTWVMLSFVVPSAIFSLVGGVIADRISKKNIMIFARLLNAMATCVLAYITFIGEVTFWDFIYFGIFNGAIGSLSIPASFSIVPEIVRKENLVNATALQTSTFNLASIIGPIVAGAIIAILSDGDTSSTYSVGLVFFVISGMFFLAAFLTMFIDHQGKPENSPTTSFTEDLREGLHFIRTEKLVLGLMVMGLVPPAFGKSLHFLLPAFNQDVIGGGPDELGMLTAGMGIGALFGSILLARLGNFKAKGFMLYRFAYGWAAAIALFTLTGNLIIAIVLGAVTAFFSSLFGSLQMSITQMVTPQYIRGRVMSLIMVMSGIIPLAVIPVGAIAEYFSIVTAFVFAAMMLALSAWVLHWVFPDLKGID